MQTLGIITIIPKGEKGPYFTLKGNKHKQEQFAYDLTIFLEYLEGRDDLNAKNINHILGVLNEFFVLSVWQWSG